MMIRLALHIKLHSSQLLDDLRANFIELPGDRTLYDYSHFTDATEGVNPDVLKIVYDRMKKNNDKHQRNVTLMFDEMSVSKKLVFNRKSRELVGYVNLDDVQKEVISMEDALKKEITIEPPQATKMLSFMIKGITSFLKFLVASYRTSNITAEELYRRTWNTVSDIEKLGLYVRVITCDGASVNRKFIRMHPPEDGQIGSVIYKTWHPRATERRLVYFMADIHHLKTARNCLSNSGAHANSTTLMNNGQLLSWQTIAKIYESREDKDFTRTVKLTANHVYLNSFSRMSVPLATQVLSASVAIEVKRKYQEQTELITFITHFNQFTDCCNGAHSQQGKRHANTNLDPYTSSEDTRLEWLLHDFLPCIKGWEQEVQ